MLSALWLVVIVLTVVGALAGGLAGLSEEYENALGSRYESSPLTDKVEADGAAQAPLPPVDYEKE
ncbi:hypothetical protein D3C72_2399110 [compost metagenome]